MLHQETILYHLEQAFYGGYTSRELRFLNYAQYWNPVNGSKNGRFMMNANKIIKLVQLEVYFEFFLIWSLSTNIIKGADLSNDLSLCLLRCLIIISYRIV